MPLQNVSQANSGPPYFIGQLHLQQIDGSSIQELNAISEFGQRDSDVTRISRDAAHVLRQTLMHVLTRAKNQGEISSDANLDSMADFFESTLAGIRMAAKAGKSRHALRNIAAFASRAYLASDSRTAAERRASRRLSIRPSD